MIDQPIIWNRNRNRSKWADREKQEEAAVRAVENFDHLSREERLRLSSYILYKYAKEKGIPVPEHDSELEIDVKKVIRENIWVLKQLKKDRVGLWEYALLNYGVNVFLKKGKIGIEKIPNEILELFLKMLSQNENEVSEDDFEKLKEMMREFRDKKSSDNSGKQD